MIAAMTLGAGMDEIGVVGLGAMGLGIVQLFAQAGFTVRGADAQPPARAAALDRIRTTMAVRVAAGKLDAAEMEATLRRITICDNAADAAQGAALIIEAVIEDPAVKRAVLTEIEAAAPQNAVLATNTSALRVASLANGLSRPENLLGLHFFNPATVMKLVELVDHGGTSTAALARARALTERTGKRVITCPDTPGFIVNRCARPYYGEALALMSEGRSASDIDAAMLAAGYRMGPLTLIDLIGADINLAATEGLAQAMGGHPRYHVFDLLRQQVARGTLGRKSGQGFLFPALPGPAPADAMDISLRIEATLANEAASLLDQSQLSPAEIDQAMMLGLNFPRGPFASARLLGHDAILATLANLQAAAPPHLSARYAVSGGLSRVF